MSPILFRVYHWYFSQACRILRCAAIHPHSDRGHICTLSKQHDAQHLCRCGIAWVAA